MSPNATPPRHTRPADATPSRASRPGSALEDAARGPPEAALARLHASPEGLTRRQALARLRSHGRNVAFDEKRGTSPARLLELVASPLSLLLLGLAAVSWATGEPRGALVIALIVVFSALLGFVQEYRSSRAAERLRAMVGTTASVLRRAGPERAGAEPAGPETAGRAIEVALEEIVPGDVVHLSAGDMVPADVRVLRARDLFVDEAALTGESLPVEKFADAPAPPDAPLAALRNVAFMGTHVVSGTALALVVATGAATHFGALARSIAGPRETTAFDRGVRRFTVLMIRFMVVMVPLVFVVNGLSRGDWLQAFLFATAVAVGLTPELLPMIVTINLAKGAIAMSREQVVVKRLNAIQDFGAMDVLCTDKTGTLTQDRVVLQRHVDLAGEESERVLELAYLNSAHQSGLKNLLDVAVLEHGRALDAVVRAGERHAKVDEVPFDFQRRRMSVIVAAGDGAHLLICKGAVDEVLAACTHARIGGQPVPIAAGHEDDARSALRSLNEDGFRVIAVACRTLPAGARAYSVADERELVLEGFVAFLDPPKESAGPAIARLRAQGVAVKILTGDGDVVARHVCRQVGIDVGRTLLGADVDALDDDALAREADATVLFARLSPAQKARVIGALHARGHVVGFLGDGINDGPALKAADVGISVDTAVDVAKESADIILLEKSLLVLSEGVLEGRKVFGNIVKYLKMSASSSFGNMLSVVGASAFLPFLPMAPVQVLFVNLLYDVSQTTVATDDVDAEYLERPRRWDIAGIGRFMLCVGPVSSLFDYATFALLLAGFAAWDAPALFHTGWFVESLLTQTLVVHVIRTGGVPFVHGRASLPLLVSTIAVCCAGVLLPASPLAPALGLVPLPPALWGALAAIVAAYLCAAQLVKHWLVRRFGPS
ncbi:MAG: magnesium-translocating P-type ATPase [Burkholderiaceae bacterium]